MGEIADWLIDQEMDAYPDWSPFASSEEPTEVECKFCGTGGLEWSHTGERWRLINSDGDFHACPRRAASADDFEVVD